MTMVSEEDTEQLAKATELLQEVVARHRGDDLRAVVIFTEAIRDIHVGLRYLGAVVSPGTH